MAILEEEVLVGLNYNNISYYEKLGYVIPRVDGKVSKGTKILVKIEHLHLGSNLRVTKICDCCGNTKSVAYTDIMEARKKDGLDRCFECGIKKRAITQGFAKYEDSAERYFLQNDLEYLIEEFSEKNDDKLTELYPKSRRQFLWKCKKCRSEYMSSLALRVSSKRGCPYCAGKKVNKTNSIRTTNTTLFNLLRNKEDGDRYTEGSNKIIDFRCSTCGLVVKDRRIYSVARQGLSCPVCSDGISYPEKFMASLLSQCSIEFQSQKTFKWSGKFKYDFYIPSLNCIIETHGAQHYQQTTLTRRSLEYEIKNDIAKKNLALSNGISNYIVINCSQSNMKFIKNSMIKNDIISKLIDINRVDWTKCHKDACRSLVFEACNLWNKGIKDVRHISSILGLSYNTIYNYLKTGADARICDYDPYVSSESRKRCVIRIDLNSNTTMEYESIAEASRLSDSSRVSIRRVCSGKRKTAGGYRWMYKEDYDKMIAEQGKQEQLQPLT